MGEGESYSSMSDHEKVRDESELTGRSWIED